MQLQELMDLRNESNFIEARVSTTHLSPHPTCHQTLLSLYTSIIALFPYHSPPQSFPPHQHPHELICYHAIKTTPTTKKRTLTGRMKKTDTRTLGILTMVQEREDVNNLKLSIKGRGESISMVERGGKGKGKGKEKEKDDQGENIRFE